MPGESGNTRGKEAMGFWDRQPVFNKVPKNTKSRP
jgi:hypothetical protein